MSKHVLPSELRHARACLLAVNAALGWIPPEHAEDADPWESFSTPLAYFQAAALDWADPSEERAAWEAGAVAYSHPPARTGQDWRDDVRAAYHMTQPYRRLAIERLHAAVYEPGEDSQYGIGLLHGYKNGRAEALDDIRAVVRFGYEP